MWDKILEVIEKHSAFVLTTHMNPDHDGIGSEVALAGMLGARGKEVRIINASPTPEDCRFLTENCKVEVFDEKNHTETIAGADVIIMLDMSIWSRLDSMGESVRASGATRLCVDHHVSLEPVGDINVVDPSFSSTGEMLVDLAVSAGFELSQEIAAALYSCILMDTGRFIYENTSSRTFRNAALLCETGFNRERVHEKLFYSHAPARYRLLGAAMQNLTLLPDCRAAYFYLDAETLDSVPPDQRDTEDFADHLRALKGVDLGIFLRPAGPGGVRLSFRSRGGACAREMAISLGGGGHMHAAGAMVAGTMEEVLEQVVGKLKAFCSAQKER